MHRNTLLGALLALLLVAAPSFADEVILKDGSRIVGTVKTLGDGSLIIEGGSAGTIQIPFANVRSLATVGDRNVVLTDGTSMMARFATSSSGEAQIVSANGTEAVNLARVTAIDPPEVKAVTHSGNVGMSAKVTDGNTHTKRVSSSAEYVRRAEDNRTTVNADWNYAENSGVLSERNTALRGKYDHFFNERLFGYGNFSLRGDKFADLDLRTTVGVGAGYQFIENETYKFYEEVGVSYFDEDFARSPDNDFAASRFSGKLDWVITPDKVNFFHFHEVFWGLEDADDILVDTSTGVRLTIIDNFFASMQINYKWDNTPAAGTTRGDTEYLLGLGYSYEF